MIFSDKFIFASPEYSTYQRFVASPYFRRTEEFSQKPDKCTITLSGLGFYRLWINGTEITKGLLAPYISNPDDIVYFDSYDIVPYLTAGKNAFCFQLGNGMQNAVGGFIWDFEKARFRGAPRFSFCVEGSIQNKDFCFEAGETVKTAASPLYFDDLRSGVRYNATAEISGWNLPDFDDSGWQNAVFCEKPRGTFRLCEAEPILPTGEILSAVEIKPGECAPYEPRWDAVIPDTQEKPSGNNGILFDFGYNKAGIIQLKINGKKGQRLELQFGETLNSEGKLFYSNIDFYPDGYSQRDVYICKEGEQTFLLPFTYHGFRYCLVTGLEASQVNKNTLTYFVCNSALQRAGNFSCSDSTANRLYEMCCNSDMSNFYYFPTDCPHREKNGWTGDAAVSAEHILMSFKAEKSYIEWLRNIRAAMNELGVIPGIIPTTGWGYLWGSGPAWDAVLVDLPYFTYKYTGHKQILEENATAILRYLNYLTTKLTARGTADFGLSDWCAVGGKCKPTREFTDSVTVMSICKRASFIFGELNMPLQKQFADGLYSSMRKTVRELFINSNSMTADTVCQTSQAYAIFYDVFDEAEKPAAVKELINIIHKSGDHIDFGLLGSRVLFHVLSDFGESELAYKMICRRDYPSYGHLIELGLTALPEDFLETTQDINSLNHHFMGDISGWFIAEVAGLKFNPSGKNINELFLRPSFISSLLNASAHYLSPLGEISVKWERNNEGVSVSAIIPDGMKCKLIVPSDYIISDVGCGACTFDKSFTAFAKKA